MKEILLELFQEAANGKVKVDGEEWPYSFNTNIEDKLIFENENKDKYFVIK